MRNRRDLGSGVFLRLEVGRLRRIQQRRRRRKARRRSKRDRGPAVQVKEVFEGGGNSHTVSRAAVDG